MLPIAKSFATPVFPAGMSRDGVDGTVNVHAKIDKEGNVSILDSFGPNAPCANLEDEKIIAFREAVVIAVEKSTFEPALDSGNKVDAELLLLYSVHSDDGSDWLSFDPNEYNPRRISEYKPQKQPSGNLVKGKALSLPKPKVSFMDALLKRVKHGLVSVYVLIDKNGNVVSAGALNGDKKIRDISAKAACKAKFSPTTLDGVPVKVSGSIVYNFKN